LNPILPKSGGYRVTVVDHDNQSGLVEKYTRYGLDTSKIEPVDIVCDSNSFAKATGHKRFDIIVAAHVIEHAPDFVRFLNDCSDVLNDDGSICLLIPDKRYCFDFMQPLSDVAKILADQRAKRTRHSFESHYRNSAHVYNGELLAWDQRGFSQLTFPYGDPNNSRAAAEQGATSDAYVDVHENYFTPISFAMIVDELRYLREIALALTVLTRPRGCEFLAVLRKTDPEDISADAFLQRKMDGCRLLLWEEQERINSAAGLLAT
jgi:SAM-dependent methyltransferase